MTLIVYSIIVLVASIILYLIERKKDMIVTPTLLLGIPYSILLVYSIIVSYTDLHYQHEVSILLPVISITYIFVFFHAGNIVKAFMNKNYINNNSAKNTHIVELKNLKIYYSIIFISFLVLFMTYVKKLGINSNIVSNFILIKNEFNSGIVAHIINITNAIIIIVFSNALINYHKSNNLSVAAIIICVLWALFLIIGVAKYTLMMFIGSLIIIYVRIFPNKVKLYRIILCMILFPILFILVYMIRFISSGISISELPFEFILSHLNYYIVSPFYAFSSVIEYSIRGSAGIGIIFAPIMNIVNIIFGEPMISTIAEFINIGNGSKSTNVFTLFGAIQYEIGFLGTIIVLIILAIFIFSLYYKNLYSPSSTNIALYSYLGSSLLIAFFNCFYGTVNVWENIIIMLLIVKIEKYKITIK